VTGRRTFLRGFLSVLLSGGAIGGILKILPSKAHATEAPLKGKWYGFGVSVDKCIGCARCVEACVAENSVPEGYLRTWVERYVYFEDGTITAVGEASVPAGATEVPCDGGTVYPGMIDAGTRLGLVEIGSQSETQDADELGEVTV